ncbi:spore germination protein GerPC [Halobacillus naozhouensis]|uniref:Spore germination protein GerPC n=1 Tax=Halobacillus naozhouensis TaxID=554880 RepID=A0ABY8J0U4_9BACI|nr:spore germination protein GerPC [Halobacillus naozhouensis]WFT76128.1 spore germination protein GerPC [Halobacillus naozhouensis]
MNNNYYQSWNHWFSQIMKQIQDQQQTIDRLTQQIEHLQTQQHPKTVIEKIEYHFDQLKIETLEGTLQIGLTPNGTEGDILEDLYTPESQPQEAAPYLDELMNDAVPQYIDNYVRENGLQLSEKHREHMIADINKQLPERFTFHQNQNPDLDPTAIVQKLHQEVRHSVAQYFTSKKGEDFV